MSVVVHNTTVKECDLEEEGTNLHLPLLREQAAARERWTRSRAYTVAVPGGMMMFGSGLRQDEFDQVLAEESSRRKTARQSVAARRRSVDKMSVRATTGFVGVLLIVLASLSVGAQSPMGSTGATKISVSSKPLSPGSDPAAASLEAYLTRVRLANTATQASPGAIWADSGRLTRMSTDVRAMRPHDLISVVVSENLAASTDGTVKNSRASSANSGVSGLLGTLHAGNAMQNLVNQNSASALTAQGASASNSSLTTTLGGQVVEVLPNGMLVIEAARQVEFAQQVQTIILRGLVRPEDISQQNQVLSTAISSLEVQVRGKGIVTDYTHRQNALVRFFQWALVF
jgi:flagellar L-ring protein precursor FlgH